MDTFEDLGLSPALVESLAAEGAEHPTPLQSIAIPIVRRGNNVVAHAGPGAGTLISYGAGLLDRLEPGAGKPRALVIAPTTLSARGLAEALARLAQGTGHAVSSLGAPWVLPERADILFATTSELLSAVRAGRVDLGEVQALVLDGAFLIQRLSGLQDVETVLEYLPREGQRIFVSLPVTAEVDDFIERHAKRAVHVPPQAAVESTDETPRRGSVRFRIIDEPKEEAALEVVAELLAEDARHVTLFFRNEDEAADAGDFLTLHGYRAGAPGDGDAPVWLAVDELQALRVIDAVESCAVVSFDVPNGPDSLDRRHGGGRGGTVLVLARELAHLRDVARRTGYRVAPAPPAPRPRLPGDLSETLDALAQAMEEEDLAPYLLVLESFFHEHAPAEVAAAAMALLRKKKAPVARVVSTAAARPGPAWVRLFISLGSRDQVGPSDLVGAITGEAGVEGSQVGKIEIKDTFSVVEVADAVAEKVIRALNGTTVRGRSVRVDFDRARRGQTMRPKRRTGGPRS